MHIGHAPRYSTYFNFYQPAAHDQYLIKRVDHDVISQDIAIIHVQYNLQGLHYVHEKQASTGNALRLVTPSQRCTYVSLQAL